jgi:hypothetical protein
MDQLEHLHVAERECRELLAFVETTKQEIVENTIG